MASIEYITKRIQGKEKEIDKLQKKLARIEKAEASGWKENPYYYSEDDKRWTMKDLEEARKALEKYEADLVSANEKAASRNVPAILKFLEMWKARCTEFYGKGLKQFYEEDARVHELGLKAGDERWGTPEYEAARSAYEEACKVFRCKKVGYFEAWEEIRNGRKYRGTTKVKDGEYEYLFPYAGERSFEDAMNRLKKDLDEEANRKYDFIIERTNEIVGKITDASLLQVGAKGDLNGYIKGERGTARVQTIGAGGYNIQCFHFRTLIHKA